MSSDPTARVADNPWLLSRPLCLLRMLLAYHREAGI